jgi:hypothetical protein
MDAFRPLLATVAAALRELGNEHGEKASFEVTSELWLSLHGRAHLGGALPWFDFPQESRYLDRLIDQVLPVGRT